MNEFFGTIYDTVFGIFANKYFLIFQHLYENGGYIKFGLAFILIPLACWLLFYYLWRFPYGKKWHWILWMAVTVLIVFVTTYVHCRQRDHRIRKPGIKRSTCRCQHRLCRLRRYPAFEVCPVKQPARSCHRIYLQPYHEAVQ